MPYNYHNKFETLKQALSAYRRVAICYSGGVDSVFLAKIAVDLLGHDNVLAVLADTPSMPRVELDAARGIASSINLNLVEVQTFEIDDPVYIANPVDRCYHCKIYIFKALIAAAQQHGFEIVLDGENFDDAADDRAGHAAAVELGVKSPLRDALLRKREIREFSRALGLATADKPALACLATRVPTGTPITRELLAKIEQAEQVAWDLGFYQVRVRDQGERAILEIAEHDFLLIADAKVRQTLVNGIIAAGYNYVSLNLLPLCRR